MSWHLVSFQDKCSTPALLRRAGFAAGRKEKVRPLSPFGTLGVGVVLLGDNNPTLFPALASWSLRDKGTLTCHLAHLPALLAV